MSYFGKTSEGRLTLGKSCKGLNKEIAHATLSDGVAASPSNRAL